MSTIKRCPNCNEHFCTVCDDSRQSCNGDACCSADCAWEFDEGVTAKLRDQAIDGAVNR